MIDLTFIRKTFKGNLKYVVVGALLLVLIGTVVIASINIDTNLASATGEKVIEGIKYIEPQAIEKIIEGATFK